MYQIKRQYFITEKYQPVPAQIIRKKYKKKDDSIFCFEHPVQTCVEISNNLDDVQSDFEYDLDTNSELSFIDDLDAVE